MTNIIQEKLPEIDSEMLFQLLKNNNVSRAYLFGKSLEETKVLIYDRESEKVFV